MLGLARHLPRGYETLFLSFSEGGRCRSFLTAARKEGFEALALEHDTPRFGVAKRDIAEHLRRAGADVLLCHGYKADLLGRPAARWAGVPVVAVARGWTGECFRVRLYERIDRLFLRWMDRVVGVSEAQAARVRRAGVRAHKVRVIHNAVHPDRFAEPDPRYRAKLMKFFPRSKSRIIGAAGRLSPEKGFAVLVAAAQHVVREDPSVGFILFGEGTGRAGLLEQIKAAGLTGSFVIAGFRNDLDHFVPWFDVLALPSFTEGLPNVALEACAASVPVVGTAAGGTPEVIEDGVNGFLVPPGDADALAKRLLELVASEEKRCDMGLAGRQRVVDQFAFTTQADRYCELFDELCRGASGRENVVPDADEESLPARRVGCASSKSATDRENCHSDPGPGQTATTTAADGVARGAECRS
jgi:glycosyltransferase involved in cell wall biosynthesis